jgi:hypothetical protein
VRRCVEDRELIERGLGAGTDHGQLPDEVVKGRSQVVEDVAQDDTETRRGEYLGLADGSDRDDQFAGLLVVLWVKAVRVVLDEPSGLAVEGLEVIPGPDDLLSTPVEVNGAVRADLTRTPDRRFRKQQVLGSNPSVGSSSPARPRRRTRMRG